MHLFFTRLAVRAGAVARGRRDRSPENIRRYVDLWHDAASAFYARQTVRSDFRVVLFYDSLYEAVVKSRPLPHWAEASRGFYPEWLERHPGLVGKPVYLTRLDADDSYSVDFFEVLSALRLERRTLILHKRFKQYDLRTQALTNQLRHPSPHFATVYFPRLPPFNSDTLDAFTGIVGDHTRYSARPHIEAPGCLALERITGFNVDNQFMKVWGTRRDVGISADLDPRFVGYHP